VGAGFCPECGTKPSGSKGGGGGGGGSGGGGGGGGSSYGSGTTTSSYTPPPQPKQTSKSCVNCGNQVPSDARFCSECGSNPDVKAQPKQTQQTQQTQQSSQPSRQATASTGYGESGGSGGGSLGTCYGCGRQIENKVVTALDKPWHPECFKCAGCGSPFSTGSGGGTFMIRDDRPYCQNCTDKTLGVCAGCGGKLTGAVLTALDKQWHPACFVCAGCKKGFTGGKFKMSPLRQGVPYCEVCVTKVQ